MIVESIRMEVVERVGLEGQLKIYSDGSVLRLPHPTTPASSHFNDGVASKDVIINPETGVWVRIFRPETASGKLPVLIHFHGGGFAVCSSAWVEFHTYFHALCKTAGILIVSVDYRLAPEHRLPAAYDDCTDAVEWIAKHAAERAESPEEWLSPSVVDFARCFLAGESAGANIVYHVGLRVAELDVRPLVVKGLICIHPWFESEEMTEFEKSAEGLKFVQMCDSLRSIALPVGSSKDHPFINPAVSPLQPGLKLPPVLVAVAGKDELYQRGVMFYEYLKSCGKEVELMEDKGGVHSFHVMLPQYEGTPFFIQQVADYVNNR